MSVCLLLAASMIRLTATWPLPLFAPATRALAGSRLHVSKAWMAWGWGHTFASITIVAHSYCCPGLTADEEYLQERYGKGTTISRKSSYRLYDALRCRVAMRTWVCCFCVCLSSDGAVRAVGCLVSGARPSVSGARAIVPSCLQSHRRLASETSCCC